MEVEMKTVRLSKNGQNQAVRLPKEYRFDNSDVCITSLDDVVMLTPQTDPWAGFTANLKRFSEDFMSERVQPKLETRDL